MQIILFILILITFHIIIPSICIPDYSNSTYSAGEFTKDDPFNAALSTALSTLVTDSASKHFSNVTVGLNVTSRVYALFSCQHDLPLRFCYGCLQNATKESLDFTGFAAKESIVIYKECMLRYANRMIFSTMELEPYQDYCTAYTYYTVKAEIGSIIKTELETLIDEATKSPDYFAVGWLYNVLKIQDVYFLVQCNPDITKEQCNKCLLHSMNLTVSTCASDGRLSGHIIGPSCLVRYDTKQFLYTVVRPMVDDPANGTKKKDGPWVTVGKVCLSILLVSLFVCIIFIKLRRACCCC